MNNIFFTEKDGKFTLPIPADGFTVNDPNNEFSEGFFVSWSYPFTIKMTPELKRIFGDLTDPNNVKRIKKTEGLLNRAGVIDVAVLKYISSKFDEAKFQFEFGIESLPINEKKLSEFDLEEITTTDLYNFIDNNPTTYPESNVAFPCIEFEKEIYNKEEFAKFSNPNRFNRFNNDGTVVRNSFEEFGQEVKNIIRPTVYVMHILKKVFEAAGYTLKGDILTDYDIKQLSLNHNNIGEDIVDQDIKKIPYDITVLDNDGKTTQEFYLGGSYNFSLLLENENSNFNIKIKEGTTILYEYDKQGQITEQDEDQMGNPITVTPQNIELFHTMPDYTTLTKVTVEITATPRESFTNNQTYIYAAYFNPVRNGQITNKKMFIPKSKLTLNQYVPDITVNQLIQAIRKAKNFKIIPVYNEIWFNYVGTEFSEFKNLEFSEQTDVEILNNEKRSLLFTYNAPEEYAYNDYKFYSDGTSESGVNLNSEDDKLELNYNPLPSGINWLSTPPESFVKTIYFIQKTESSTGIEFVFGSGNGLYDPYMHRLNIDLPGITTSTYKNVIKNRLLADTFKWSFNSQKPEIRSLNSGDTVYAYQCYHKIINLTKKYFEDKNGQLVYFVDIETENRY